MPVLWLFSQEGEIDERKGVVEEMDMDSLYGNLTIGQKHTMEFLVGGRTVRS